MNWEAIGSIGEIIGAIAVVITIAYLATQIRQNTKSNKTAAIQTISAQNAEWLSLLEKPDGTAYMFYVDAVRGLDNLNEKDRARYVSIMIHMSRLYDTQLHLYQMGAVPQELWDSSLVTLRSTFESKGARDSWVLTRHLFTAPYRSLVDNILNVSDAA